MPNFRPSTVRRSSPTIQNLARLPSNVTRELTIRNWPISEADFYYAATPQKPRRQHHVQPLRLSYRRQQSRRPRQAGTVRLCSPHQP
eukprot:3663305-Pleurochrysis_carterae.AAC.1